MALIFKRSGLLFVRSYIESHIMLTLLGLFIFVLPLALASSSTAEPVTVFASLYLCSFLIFSVFWIIVKGSSFEKLRPLKYPLIFTALLLLIAAGFSLKHFHGLEEILRYALGLIFFMMIAPLHEDDKKRLIPWIFLGALVVSVLAIYQYFFGFDLLRDYVLKEKIMDPFIHEKIAQRRVFYPFPTPGILGGYLAMTLPLAFQTNKRILLLIPLACALLLTRSLGAILSLTMVSAALFLLLTHASKKKTFSLLALGVILGCVFALRMHNPNQHLLPTFSLTTRFEYWKQTWEIIQTHPWIGVGIGNFDLRGSLYAHNSFLQLWAEAGLAGIVSFLWLIIAILRNGWKRLQAPSPGYPALGLMAGISIFLVHNLMDFTFFLPATSLIWCVMLGLLYSAPSQTSR